MSDQPSTLEEGKAHFGKYMEWLSALGEAVVSPANPLKDTRTVNSDGAISEGGSTKMSGYTILQAETMDEALEMVKACPFLDIGGSLEVAELMQMPS